MKLLPLPREKRRLLEPLGRAALTCLLTAGSFGGLCVLKAATKNVGGVAKGEMILEIPNGSTNVKAMEQYLIDRGLELEELSETKTGGAF